MVESEELKAILARKQAGVERMQLRQQRVHARLADHVEQHPKAIQAAINKLESQLEKPHCTAQEIYREWLVILSSRSVEDIVSILRDTSEATEQLRSCAPFSLA